MAEKLDPNQIVDLRELLMSEVIQSEALINLLDRKGIITKQKLLEEMKRVQASLPKSDLLTHTSHLCDDSPSSRIELFHSFT